LRLKRALRMIASRLKSRDAVDKLQRLITRL